MLPSFLDLVQGQSMAKHGKAWQSMAKHGKAWQSRFTILKLLITFD